MANSEESRRAIVAYDAAFKSLADVRGWGAPTAACGRCGDPAPAYNEAGRCVFCEVGAFLGLASLAARAAFVDTGAVAW